MPKQADVATRAAAVALKAYTDKTSSQIAAITGLSVSTINRIYAKAIERGFEPHHNVIEDAYVVDAPRSGRPTKQDSATTDNILSKVGQDHYGREKSCADLASELNSELGIEISSTTVWRIRKNAGLRKTKPTRKPGLTKEIKADHLA